MKNVNFEVYSKIEIYDMADNLIGRSEIQSDTKTTINVSAPIGLDGLKILEVGQKLKAIYYNDGKAYKFITKVESRFVDQIKIFVLLKPETCEVIQRRESVRVDLSKTLSCCVITEAEKNFLVAQDISPAEIKTEFFIRLKTVFTYNISAGGLGIFMQSDEVKIGDYLVVFIDIDSKEEFMLMQVVKIVRDDFLTDSKARKIGARLIQGTKGQQERMFQYLFKVMREQSFVKERE